MKSRIIIATLLASLWLGSYADDQLVKKPLGSGNGGSVQATLVGDQYVLAPIPATNYRFLQWLDGTTDSLRYVAESSIKHYGEQGIVDYKAVFTYSPVVETNRADITVTVPTANVEQYHISLDICDVNTFICWSDNQSGTERDYTEADGNLRPCFRPMDTEATGDAAVGHVDLTNVDCGYQLTAVPEAGYAFKQWTDDANEPATRTVSLLAGEYSAQFANANYKVGDKYFLNFADALAEGGTIEILEDVASQDIIVVNEQELTLKGNGHSVKDITIQNGGKLTLDNALTAANLYLSTTSGASSQLINPSNMTYTAAYVDITLDPTKVAADDSKWYMIGVPFDVNVTGGITFADDPTARVQETDFILWNYDGALRASTGNGWELVKATDQMHAGRCYMFGVEGNTQNTWRFAKANNSQITDQTSITLNAHIASDPKNANWNSIANATMRYANLSSAKATIAQAYVNTDEEEHYEVRAFNEYSAVMAAPFFVQADGGTLNLETATHSKLFATQRADEAPDFYRIEIGHMAEKEFIREDVVYLSINEKGANTYTVGKDVVKMIGSDVYTYLYTEAYGQKLCAQEAVPQDNAAEYKLMLKVPQAGNYVVRTSESALPVYLLQEGITLAQLNEGDYTLSATKGINQFTLRIGDKSTPTYLNELYKTQNDIKKIIYKDHLYIIRDGKMYSSQGVTIR